MSRVTFVNRTYWPGEEATAQLLTDLAEGLAAAGSDTRVITGRRPGLPESDHHRGVEIIRVGPRVLPQGGFSVIAKARAFSGFLLAARRTLRAQVSSGDQVVLLTDPPLLGPAVSGSAERRGARCVHWVQDIYPEIAMELLGTRSLGLLRGVRDRAWMRAAGCVAVSESMAQTILSRGVGRSNLWTIPNWAPRELEVLPDPAAVVGWRRSHGFDDGFLVGYSGNLGRAHDLNPILRAAGHLPPGRGLTFAFIGDGPQREALERSVAEARLGCIRFLPPQPRRDLAVALSAIDVHLVSQRPSCQALVFPSKLYGIAATGRPVVSIGAPDSELARVVTQHGFGVHHAPEDTAGLANTLLHLQRNPELLRVQGLAARAFYQRFGRFEHALMAWADLLQRVDGRLRSSPNG